MPSSSSAWAVIVAAGEGRRFGGHARKQFADLAGKPTVLHALEAFRAHPAVDGASLVLPAEAVERPPSWLARLAEEGVRVVAGGSTRTDSVRAGLRSVPDDVAKVAVHDGVRPLITAAAITRVLERVSDRSGVAAGRPLTDSLKEVDQEGRVVGSVSRAGLWRAETPQAFPRRLLEEVYERADREGLSASDCAGLCERYGVGVVMVELDEPNLKITRPADLALAEAVLRARREGGPGARGS